MNQNLKEHKNKTILLVTHGGFIRSLLSIFLNKPIQEMTDTELPNTCLSIVEVKSDHKFEVKLLGSVEHLESETGKGI